MKPDFFFARHVESASGPVTEIRDRSFVAENLRRPSLGGVARVCTSSSGESSLGDPAGASGGTPSGWSKSKRNRPRSQNWAAFARHHQGLREEGEISLIAEEGSLATTLPVEDQNVSGLFAPVATPVVLGASRDNLGGLRRWVIKPPSVTRWL